MINKPGQIHGTLEASVAAIDTADLSFLACISAGDTAATALFAVLNWIIVGCGGSGVIVSRFDRVDDVNVLVEDG